MYKLFASYRPALPTELGAINALIESAVMNWPMPIRLKQRAVPVLQYDEMDMRHFEFFVCERGNEIIGVAALDREFAPGQGLLHGLFVLPIIQGHGIGRALMQMAFDAARAAELHSVRIRAERVAAPYFQKPYFQQQGFEKIEPTSVDDYQHQFEVPLLTQSHVELARAS